MSLAIDAVQAVLLADGWHTVHNASFTLDADEDLWSGRPSVKVQDLENESDARLLHEGGDSGISSKGFAFATDESGTTIAGPLTPCSQFATTSSVTGLRTPVRATGGRRDDVHGNAGDAAPWLLAPRVEHVPE